MFFCSDGASRSQVLEGRATDVPGGLVSALSSGATARGYARPPITRKVRCRGEREAISKMFS